MLVIFFRLLCTLLVILFTIVIWSAFNFEKKQNAIDEVKKNISDFMDYPHTAEIRNVRFYPSFNIMSDNVSENICGEVFTFENEIPYKYKRFILQVMPISNTQYSYTSPLVDFEGSEEKMKHFQKLWEQFCRYNSN